MAYERHRGWDEAPQGISGKTIFVVGLILLAIGLFVVLHATTGQVSLPPASAQEIPATVGTAVPFPVNPSAVAPALPPSAPVQIEIPALGVKAPVMRLGKNSDGTVQVPPLGNHNLAGWYDGSVTPGADGSSVILGHVDNYTGPSVFFSIKNLHAGDKVDVVRANGSVAVFAVDGVQKVAKTQFPTSDVYGNVRYPSLRLVTCGGPFNAGSGEYVDNIVVYAHLTGVRTASALAVNGAHATGEAGRAAGDTGTGSFPAVSASGVATTTTTFSAAGTRTATASHLQQVLTSTGTCPDRTCTRTPGTITISVTVRRHHGRGRHHPGGGPGPPGGGPGPPGGGPGPSGGGPGPSGGGPGSPGSFTFTVTPSAPTLTGTVHPLVLGGNLPGMTVTDTRTSHPGWSVRGQVSDFTGSGTAAGSVISGNQLGWSPFGTVTGGATLGRQVDPASPGLGSIPAVLASAAAGSGSGTDTLSARLLLDIPATAQVGTYNVILTITCVESAP